MSEVCEHEFIMTSVSEDYLVWVCVACCKTRLEHFSEMDDESWEWTKRYFRREDKK